MTDPRREREIFELALEQQGEAREALLCDLCRDDDEMLSRVQRLLTAHHHAENLSTLHSPDSMLDAGEEDPQEIGPYKILQRIGKGGMGVVYLAEQSHPVRRKVALKVIKAGMDTQEVIARFHAERQALALMTHANIARILATGTNEQGRPYFVMEYVPGIPLPDYCHRNRLSVAERLELFVRVCTAVEHAHQKRIIHRDLKPSNILVMEEDDRPVPKIIDFGIAKAMGYSLSEMTVHTQLGQLIGTPEYMSPEQAGVTGLDVDTRADVYSLGAVLYQLLTGCPPFEFGPAAANLADMQRILREDDPLPPSARLRSVHRELDWITMRALEKNRTRRYATAEEMAADVRRHLAGEPLSVGPPGVTYRLRKFARRNAGVLVATSIAVMGLVIGVVGTSVGRSYLGLPGQATLATEASTLMILPLEVRGQVDGPEYVGRAFSETLAMNLSRATGLRVLPVPAPGEMGEGGALSNAPAALERGAGRLLSGSLTRDGDAVTVSISLVATRQSQVLWGSVVGSPHGEMQSLASTLAMQVVNEMGAQSSKLYDDLERSGAVSDPQMAASPLLATVLHAFHREDNVETVLATAQLLDAFPGDPDAVMLRSRALLRSGWQVDPTSSLRAEIDESIRAIRESDRNSPWHDFHNAILLNQDRRYEESVEILTRLLARSDLTQLARAEMMDARSLSYREMGDMNAALRDMEEAVRLDPMDSRGLAGLGELLREMGRVDEGLERGRQSVALNPRSYVSRVNLAWQLSFQDREQEAIKQAREAHRLAPEDVQTNWALGRILYRFEHWKESALLFDNACTLSGDGQWCALQACALQHAGEPESAAAAAVRSEELPEGVWKRLYLAAYLALQGDAAGAVTDLYRHLELNKNYNAGYANAVEGYPDFQSLRGDDGFEGLLEKIRTRGEAPG